MRRVLIPMLLSALVFPGMGQLYNQDRKKGVILVLLGNLLLALLILAMVMLFSTYYYTVFYPAPLTLAMLRQLLLNMVTHPLFFVPFALLVCLWTFATVDAGRTGARRAREGA